ncbi:FAD-dependent oxidoreductase, partial [Escherichia coli]|uniref:FAD-dependent oxidoreductase n=1 Tax=Escherichia coli TaxID=562 RepID=UPI0014120BFC
SADKPPDWAPKSLYTLRDGLESLPRAIAASLGDRLRLSTPVERIEPGSLTVHAGGEAITADRIVVACPSTPAAALLPDLAPLLDSIPRA